MSSTASFAQDGLLQQPALTLKPIHIQGNVRPRKMNRLHTQKSAINRTNFCRVTAKPTASGCCTNEFIQCTQAGQSFVQATHLQQCNGWNSHNLINANNCLVWLYLEKDLQTKNISAPEMPITRTLIRRQHVSQNKSLCNPYQAHSKVDFWHCSAMRYHWEIYIMLKKKNCLTRIFINKSFENC